MALQQSDTPPSLSSHLNWPNRITLVRIFLVPLLLVFLISPQGWYPLVAATIFLVAAFTDWLDGHLARSTNQITRLNSFWTLLLTNSWSLLPSCRWWAGNRCQPGWRSSLSVVR